MRQILTLLFILVTARFCLPPLTDAQDKAQTREAALSDGASAPASVNSLGMKLVETPAGAFQMGNSEEPMDRDLCFTEHRAHRVRITQPFRISVTEVTLEQYRRFKPEFGGTQECLPYGANGIYLRASICRQAFLRRSWRLGRSRNLSRGALRCGYLFRLRFTARGSRSRAPGERSGSPVAPR